MALKQTLIEQIKQAVLEAQKDGTLPPVALPEVVIEHPQNPGHGDYASSLPLKLARATGINPMKIATDCADRISTPEVSKTVAAAPGFINFTLKSEWLAKQVNSILNTGDSYGNIEIGRGKRVQIEFVSVNPTGPLHVGHGRGAILGSTLASVLTAAGFEVEKEYYINDAGNQIDSFYRSLYARYQQSLGTDAEIPADGYIGSYIVDLAKEIINKDGDRFLKLPETEAIPI